MTIQQWPASERPREKLLLDGAQALSDAELLAIFLRVGTAGKSAVELARDLIVRFGSLTRLFGASARELRAVKGIGTAKYAQLQAVLEMARRALGESLRQEAAFDSPQAVQHYLRLTLAGKPHEIFYCLFLNAQHQLIRAEPLFRGSLTQTSVYPGEVARQALLHNAAAVIAAHNHPSGKAVPSQADIQLTKRLANALQLVDVRLLDHFIVGQGEIYSFAAHGRV